MSFIRLLLSGMLWLTTGTACLAVGDLPEEERKFLKAHAARVLELIEEAREKGYEEVLEEAYGRVERMREEGDSFCL